MNMIQDSEGFSIRIPAKTQAKEPVYIQARMSADSPSRNRIVVETGSSADVVINYLSEEVNIRVDELTEVRLEENASLNIVLLQRLNPSTHLKTHTIVNQAADSMMKIHYIVLSGESIDNRLQVNLTGKNAEHIAHGLTFTEGTEHTGNHVQIVHAAPECRSNQLFKHILSGTSTGNFIGKIIVNKDAQKTTAYQRSSNILLNNKAKMDIQPQLEIYADDVKCSHGATVGQLDSEALFYLQTRGIDKQDAEKILLRAFAEETLDNINIENVKNEVIQYVNQKLITS
ncbi:MAG: Fe-S cluster assembly protein SufD [Bacteroidales bacterium]|nr:Fe-S cluster assembly protein SufD [Bacteroidales bacterium]